MPEAQPAPAAPESSAPPPVAGSGQPAAGSEAATQPANGNGAGAAPKPSGTILDGDAGATITAPADFPDDWRARMSGGDEKAVKALERYKSPKEVAAALLAAQTKIRSGETAKPVTLPENATDEQVTEYRKALGIPEKHDGYEIKLPDGVALGGADKPVLDSFLKYAHGKHLPPDAVNVAANWYTEFAAAQAEEMQQAVRSQRVETMSTLQSEWGAETKPNLQALGNYLDTLPDGIGEAIVNAAGPDGLPLVNDIRVAKWLVGMALDANPAATFIPGDGSNKTMANRKAEIEKVMKTDINAYWKDAKMQQDFADILARESRGSKKS